MRCLKRENNEWCPNEPTSTGLCVEHLPGVKPVKKRRTKAEAEKAA